MKLDEEIKIKIGKYSSKNGVSAAARCFSAELERDINPSTIRGFKRAYLQELNRKKRADLTVTSLPAKKRGLRSPTYAVDEIKFLPQYKGRAIGKNFIPRIFCGIQ